MSGQEHSCLIFSSRQMDRVKSGTLPPNHRHVFRINECLNMTSRAIEKARFIRIEEFAPSSPPDCLSVLHIASGTRTVQQHGYCLKPRAVCTVAHEGKVYLKFPDARAASIAQQYSQPQERHESSVGGVLARAIPYGFETVSLA